MNYYLEKKIKRFFFRIKNEIKKRIKIFLFIEF